MSPLEYHNPAKDKGFTLVEILIVITIIAILAAIAIPQFTSYRNRSLTVTLQSDAKNSYIAAQAWLTDNPNSACCTNLELETSGFRPSTGTGATTIAGARNIVASGNGTFTIESSSVNAAEPGTGVATVCGNGNILYGAAENPGGC